MVEHHDVSETQKHDEETEPDSGIQYDGPLPHRITKTILGVRPDRGFK